MFMKTKEAVLLRMQISFLSGGLRLPVRAYKKHGNLHAIRYFR